MAATGSKTLDQMVERLAGASDPKRRYAYVLWLARKLPVAEPSLFCDENRVRGCISQVYVRGFLQEGKLHWQGDSDAQITKGLLALLMAGTEGLAPGVLVTMSPAFIQETGLQASLTPSRANGFLNIFKTMQTQAKLLAAAPL
ncbi:MAG: cysteine desufuration protein SufE [Candidatus Synechococcus spongiarum 142]|uniref:Cysteine desufuration protein SufE n=1 Tax=Candidatus Synechococcus spongiarum 142 TaxID=1608213 RepID=A0A6N3X7S4_9SYNE|nr:MAG: cysteine desufuration protein SufE [Candidatus Synechococcus spongiarum 142]